MISIRCLQRAGLGPDCERAEQLDNTVSVSASQLASSTDDHRRLGSVHSVCVALLNLADNI